ncbi:hypothetical protein FVER53590_27567 [Fusarium verticillioides]|nr:hypothetical protein FVER53590_27567 [Fusarium verticillioides]
MYIKYTSLSLGIHDGGARVRKWMSMWRLKISNAPCPRPRHAHFKVAQSRLLVSTSSSIHRIAKLKLSCLSSLIFNLH